MSARRDMLIDPRQIAACAYLIWQSEGCPNGREEAHWLEAEAQLRADLAADAGIMSRHRRAVCRRRAGADHQAVAR